MSEYTGTTIVFGAGSVAWMDDTIGPQIVEVLREEGVRNIDTAPRYPNSEKTIGERGAAQEFVISTKWSHGYTGVVKKSEDIIKSFENSLRLLRTDRVDIYYFHAPDRVTPLEVQLSAVTELHKQGRFSRFGLSNYLPEEVEEIVRLAQAKGFVQPSVYQGNYSVIARKPEERLLPILRKYSIAFYVYSPIAGGFLAKTRASIESGGVGRWDPKDRMGQIYHELYNKPAMLEALDKWNAISLASGIPKVEMAYRWVAHNSVLQAERGDAVVFGASSAEQARQTVRGIKRGPLPREVADQIDGLWELVKDDAPFDNFNG